MGFRIVILGAVDASVAQIIKAKADELPWDLSWYGKDFTAESQASVESFFQLKKPSVVLSLMAEPGDHAPISSLKNVASVCARQNLPLVLQSSYWAVEPDDGHGEVLESLQAAQHPGSHEYAYFEELASSVDRHIILRSSWLLDGDGAGLFASLLPALLNGEEIFLSDHDFGAPVSCEYIADAIIALVQQILTGANNWGVYHLRSADACSEAEFCDHVVRQLEKELDKPVKFPSVASQDDQRRFLSMNANLVGRKITDDFGIQSPTWRRGFGRTLRAWLQKHAKELGVSTRGA